MFGRNRHYLVRERCDTNRIPGKKRDRRRMPKRIDERMRVPELAGMADRPIRRKGCLVEEAIMLQRPGQVAQRGRADILTIAKRKFPMFIGLVQRRRQCEVGQGFSVISTDHQRSAQHAVTD